MNTRLPLFNLHFDLKQVQQFREPDAPCIHPHQHQIRSCLQSRLEKLFIPFQVCLVSFHRVVLAEEWLHAHINPFCRWPSRLLNRSWWNTQNTVYIYITTNQRQYYCCDQIYSQTLIHSRPKTIRDPFRTSIVDGAIDVQSQIESSMVSLWEGDDELSWPLDSNNRSITVAQHPIFRDKFVFVTKDVPALLSMAHLEVVVVVGLETLHPGTINTIPVKKINDEAKI